RDAVAARHAHVHAHDVGPLAARDAHGVGSVRRLAHHLEALALEDHGEAGADDGLVVHEHDAGHEASWGRGSRAVARGTDRRTTHAPSGARRASSVPPRTAARSRMPTSPWPGPDPGSGTVPAAGLRTVRTTSASDHANRTSTGRPGACRRAFASASCSTRYTAICALGVGSHGVPSVRTVTVVPAARAVSRSAGTSASVGC